jgi:hypothetical protein
VYASRKKVSLVVSQDTGIADSDVKANSSLAVWRSLGQRMRNMLAQFRTILCDECSQPIHWWNRRVWAIDGEGCAHPQCWNGRQFLKSYVQLTAEEMRISAASTLQPDNNEPGNSELQQLRTAARVLRERAERLEAQLREAEILVAKIRISSRNHR